MKIPGSYYYKRFRRRFRIPYELFYPLVEECKQHKIFDSVADTIGTGHTKKIPIEFKVLASLRMLGRQLQQSMRMKKYYGPMVRTTSIRKDTHYLHMHE